MDRIFIKKVMTFKSGNFVFSAAYDDSVLNQLLTHANILYTTIADLPVLPEWSATLEEELIRRSIFSTAAIEGSPLKEIEVHRLIDQAEEKQDDSSIKKAILNLKKVYSYIKTLEPAKGPPLITEGFLRESHRIITDGLDYKDNSPGKFRNHTVKVGDREHGGVYTPPKCQADIITLVKEFMDWINSEEIIELNSFIRAALAHYHLGLIHPFGNGNGRTIRIVEAMLLRTAGIKYIPTMLSNYYYRNIYDYYFAFSSTRKNPGHDVTDFLRFVLKGVIESLTEIKNDVTVRIRYLVMRDYYAFLKSGRVITQRQHDLLIMLLTDMKTLSLKDLFNVSPYNLLYRNVSERTARRDLMKLLDIGVMSHADGNYKINLKILG